MQRIDVQKFGIPPISQPDNNPCIDPPVHCPAQTARVNFEGFSDISLTRLSVAEIISFNLLLSGTNDFGQSVGWEGQPRPSLTVLLSKSLRYCRASFNILSFSYEYPEP